MSDWIEIDGSEGEGGGQVLRTSLALAIAVGRPLRLTNVRAGRSRPGLMRQHLTSLLAAAAVGRAEVDGATIGSTTVAFKPSAVVPGEHRFSVGTAGSATLVLQTVLPPLLTASAPSHLVLEGGTHNPMAPPLPFLERVFAPLINRMGSRLTLTADRIGFYPAGGGRFSATIEPTAKLTPLEILDGGEVSGRRAEAIVANIGLNVAERELQTVKRQLGWSEDCLHATEIERSSGPGNVLLLEIERGDVREIVTGFGEKGVRAEGVADRACKEMQRYLAHKAPIGEHLADQLLIPLALAGGGSFRTGPLSLHARTNMSVIERFLPVKFAVREEAGRTNVVEVSANR